MSPTKQAKRQGNSGKMNGYLSIHLFRRQINHAGIALELGWVQAQVHHRGFLGINRETNISVDAIYIRIYG